MDRLSPQIVQKAEAYLAGKNTLQEFEDWFIPETWDYETGTCDDSTVELIRTIQLYLAEYSNRHRTEAELADLMRDALNPQPHVPGKLSIS